MNNEPKAYTMKEEGNTGVEKEPKFETYSPMQIAVYAVNCSNSDEDIEYVRHAIQSSIDQQNAACLASLKELIPIAEDLYEYLFTELKVVKSDKLEQCVKLMWNYKSAIERAKAIVTPSK